MRPAGPIAHGKPSRNQREALLSLLGDDDPAIYSTIRQKILSFGPEAIGWLRPHLLAADPVTRRRARELIHYFEKQAADTEFLGFCLKHGEDFDIEEGAWLLARTQYPEMNETGYRALVDSFASDLREKVNPSGKPEDILKAINRYLFGLLRFAGDQKDYYNPENSYLNRVIDRRTGNPINLCLLYVLICRRLRLPVTGIGLPGHFICRFQSPASEIYLDPFNSGKLLTKADCVQYLLKGSYSVRDDYLSPVTPRRWLLRICGNLHQIYLRQDNDEQTTRLQRYMIALAK